MPATRSPSSEMPHSVGALIDTAFVRTAFADAAGPAGSRPAARPTAWARTVTWARAALARLASRA